MEASELSSQSSSANQSSQESTASTANSIVADFFKEDKSVRSIRRVNRKATASTQPDIVPATGEAESSQVVDCTPAKQLVTRTRRQSVQSDRKLTDVVQCTPAHQESEKTGCEAPTTERRTRRNLTVALNTPLVADSAASKVADAPSTATLTERNTRRQLATSLVTTLKTETTPASSRKRRGEVDLEDTENNAAVTDVVSTTKRSKQLVRH